MTSTNGLAKRPSGKRSVNNSDIVRPYEGYHPISASALAEQTHRINEIGYDENVASTFQRKSFRPVVFCSVMLLAFFFVLVWQILIGNCQISLLCRLVDKSSRFTSRYRFRTFDFKVPSYYVWFGITSGSAALLVASILLLILKSDHIHSKKISFIMGLIKQSSAIILTYHYLVLILPTVTLVLIFGFSMNWNIAWSFFLGVTVCMLGNQVATQLHVKAVSKLSSVWLDRSMSILQLFSYTTFKAAIICISIYALFSISTSALYLMYTDLPAASAFSGGSALVLLITRVSNTALFEANVSAFTLKPPYRANLPPNVVTVLSSNILAVSGVLTDLFVSFAISVLTTALTGSSMPYFSQNQLATCVFNHLHIDKTCGPFGYPQTLSHASYICNSRNFYFDYPFLSESASASIFVATPFVLVASSMLVYFLCWPLLCFRLKHNVDVDGERIDQETFLETFSVRYYRIVALTACMLIVASAAVCFGLFGPSSQFQNSKSFGGANRFPRILLDGSPTQCLPNTEGPIIHIPKGGIRSEGPYEPLLVTGRSLGEAAETGKRLFACNCFGIIFGTITVLLYTWLNTQRAPINKRSGVMSSSFKNISFNFLTQTPAIGLIVIVLISSYELYGAYGVGIAAIGYVSVSTSSTLFLMTGRMVTNVRNLLIVTHLFDSEEDNFHEIGIDFCSTATAAGNIVNNCASLMVCAITIFATMLQAGLWLSPRDLVGSTVSAPSKLLSFPDDADLSSILVIAGALLGAIAPVVIWAVLNLGVDRSASGIFVARKVLGHNDLLIWPRIIGRLLRLTMLENSCVFLVGLLWPTIVGFGLGVHSMIAMLVIATSTSFVIAGIMNDSGVTTVDGVPNEVGKVVREVKFGTSPAFQALMKTWVTLGLVMSTAMNHNAKKWWIGLIVFVISGAILGFISWRNHIRYGKILEFGGIRDEPQKWEGPGVQVSPFYEDANTMHLEWMGIGSELREKLRSLGLRRGRFGIDRVVDSENGNRRHIDAQKTNFSRLRTQQVGRTNS